MSIPDRENKLNELKAEYSAQMERIVATLKSSVPLEDPKSIGSAFHQAGVKFFNEFERTLDEYGLPEFQITQDIINRKGEDALNFVKTITNHWIIHRKFCKKFGLDAPQPSETAYASMQRVIKKFYPDKSKSIESQFLDAELPVHGFQSTSEHSGWTMKKDKTLIVLGGVFLLLGAILAFVFDRLNGIQYLFLRTFLSLGSSALAVGCFIGSVKVQWSVARTLVVTASGGFALFILFHFVNPPSPPNPIPLSQQKMEPH